MGRISDLFKKPSAEKQAGFRILPDNITYPNFVHVTKRGFIARKIAHYLEMDKSEADQVFLISLLKPAPDLLPTEIPYRLVKLSEQILQWTENRENIMEKIDSLDLDSQTKNAVLKVYEIHKKDFTTPVQQRPLPDKTEKWMIYRDVINSATQGKFTLISQEDLSRYQQGEILLEQRIIRMADIPKCRQAAKEQLERKDYDRSKLMSWLLVISEAITNALKHAEEGKMTLLEDPEMGELRVIVEDNGPGFELETLPQAILKDGYSTKKSLGQGFNLMLKMSEKVSLFTYDNGSTLVLALDSGK
ncbi:MAG TPA: ATP-binding protein [Bacillales bacterium]